MSRVRDPRGQQRLMGVAERRVREQAAASAREPIGELLRPELLNLSRVPAAAVASQSNCGTRAGTRRSALGGFCDGRPLTMMSPGSEELGGTVLSRREVKQFGRLVDKPGRAVAGQKVGMRDQVDQERNVRLHAADAEFLQAALHAAGGVDEARGRGRSPSRAANRRTA